MILDYIAFTYVLYRVGLPLILSLPNPRKFEEERIRRARRHDIWFHARRGFFDCFLVGGAFLAAWQHADLGILWLVLGVALIGLAVPTSFALGISRITALPEIPTAEVSGPELDRFAQKRRRMWLVQIPLLLAWCYSWRGLAV